MKVTVIVTVRNEAGTVHDLLDSLASQTRRPDEVIIADGGSTDGTLDLLAEYGRAGRLPLRIVERPGSNISAGRNAAISAAAGDIIAVTDAGVRFGADWLAELIRPFEDEAAPDVVCGFFVPDPRSLFEVAMGATVLPIVEEVRAERFMPSSRSVAFRRAAWESVGGYPEWMSFSEDLLFDLALKNRGLRFVFAPRAVVAFRPRASLAAFWRQYRNYAVGDGEGLLWTRRHLIRYGTYLAALPLVFAGGLLWSAWCWSALLLGLAVYLRRPYRRLVQQWCGLSPAQKLAAMLWVPVIRVWGDLAKMVGYPQGLPRGFRNKARTWTYVGWG
jgi:cellulose synthase/poly-beta-1,6-N-acetylglucosamine synthase-like glycosyltransferase